MGDFNTYKSIQINGCIFTFVLCVPSAAIVSSTRKTYAIRKTLQKLEYKNNIV